MKKINMRLTSDCLKKLCFVSLSSVLVLTACEEEGAIESSRAPITTPQKSPPQESRIELNNEQYSYHLVLPVGWQASASDGADLKESASISLQSSDNKEEIKVGICRGEWGICVHSDGIVVKETKEPTILDGLSAILFHDTNKAADGSQSQSQHIETVRNGYTYDIYTLLKDGQQESSQAFAQLIRDWKWIQSEQITAGAKDSVKLQTFRMVDDLHGWAISSDEAVLTTSDSGEHWKSVTPNGVRLQRGAISSFYNSKTAWIAEYSDVGKEIEIYRTSDGGATWKETKIPSPTQLLNLNSLEFLNSKNGWLSVMPDHGMNSSPGMLLSTLDGGEHWSVVSKTGDTTLGTSNLLPFGGNVHFRSYEQGWIVGSQVSTGTTMLYYTENSGRSWKKIELPLPEGVKEGNVEAALPLFFSDQSKAGFIPAIFQPTDGETAKFTTIIYETTDNGRTWRGRPLPSEITSVGSVSAYADTQHWFIWNSDSRSIPVIGKLFRTADSGRNWTEVKLDQTLSAELDKNETIFEMQFTSAQYGWALLQDPNRVFAKLLKTADGGQTWKAMDTKLVSK